MRCWVARFIDPSLHTLNCAAYLTQRRILQ
jgi:hypothetical protein